MLLFSLNFFSQKELLHPKQKVKDKKYIKLSKKKIPRQSIVTHIPLLAAGA